MIRNKTGFYDEELSTSRPNPKLEDHPLSAVRDCLFNIFAAALHIGGRSSTRNLKMVYKQPVIVYSEPNKPIAQRPPNSSLRSVLMLFSNLNRVIDFLWFRTKNFYSFLFSSI
jgi:hypothetical protein